jgi:hypothetical protein
VGCGVVQVDMRALARTSGGVGLGAAAVGGGCCSSAFFQPFKMGEASRGPNSPNNALSFNNATICL